jgi:hypothetical protein
MFAATVPDWIVRTPAEVRDSFDEAGRLDIHQVRQRHQAITHALHWVCYGGGAPISGVRRLQAPTRLDARKEYAAALYVAYYGETPTPQIWQRLGYTLPIHPVGDTREYAYGAWRTLGWLIGDLTATPPTEDIAMWPMVGLPHQQMAEVTAAVQARRAH